jgi:hypothetical protein
MFECTSMYTGGGATFSPFLTVKRMRRRLILRQLPLLLPPLMNCFRSIAPTPHPSRMGFTLYYTRPAIIFICVILPPNQVDPLLVVKPNLTSQRRPKAPPWWWL